MKIQDIAPKKINNSYSNKSVNTNSLVVISDEGKFFLNSGQESTNPEGFEFYDMRALNIVADVVL